MPRGVKKDSKELDKMKKRILIIVGLAAVLVSGSVYAAVSGKGTGHH